jgi:hypothetical protein
VLVLSIACTYNIFFLDAIIGLSKREATAIVSPRGFVGVNTNITATVKTEKSYVVLERLSPVQIMISCRICSRILLPVSKGYLPNILSICLLDCQHQERIFLL